MIPKAINRPTKQIRVPSLRLQKQLPENPFIHIQLPILLMTLLMITFHWLGKVPTLLSFFFIQQNERKGCFEINCQLSLHSKSAIKTAVMHQNVWDVGQPSRYCICLLRQLHPNARIRRTEFLICACIQLKFLEVICCLGRFNRLTVSESFHEMRFADIKMCPLSRKSPTAPRTVCVHK